MGEPALEPCPFCDSEADYIRAGSVWAVLCGSCAAQSGWRFPKRKAADAWNMRGGRRLGQMTIWEVDR